MGNKIIIDDKDDDLMIINKIKIFDQPKECEINTNYNNIQIIKSTELRLPSNIIDLSYDSNKNK